MVVHDVVARKSVHDVVALNTYEIAIIGGGFTVIGTALGAWLTYRFAITLAERNTRVKAGAKLRAAFSPEISEMRLLAQGHKKVDVEHLLKSAFSRHATAIEEFSPYLCKEQKEKYYEAWRSYYEVAGSIRFFDYYMGDKPYDLFFERIHAILKFT